MVNNDCGTGFSTTLADGEIVDLRPVTKNDWQTIQNGMSALSSQSRYFRFFSAIARLSDSQLHYLTEVDQHDHVAWIALARDGIDHHGIGIARFIRFDQQPKVAEFAVTVIDCYQKRGLGTLLMAVLYWQANLNNIELLRGFVLPENTVTLAWLSRLGAISHYENGVYQLDIPIHPNQPLIPSAPF